MTTFRKLLEDLRRHVKGCIDAVDSDQSDSQVREIVKRQLQGALVAVDRLLGKSPSSGEVR